MQPLSAPTRLIAPKRGEDRMVASDPCAVCPELSVAAPLAHADLSRMCPGGSAGLFNCGFGLDVFIPR